MTIEQKFIDTIEKVIADFEKTEGDISTKEANDILHIKSLLESDVSLIELHALVKDFVINKMSRKLFAFLPFVNDLKTHLINALNNPTFDPLTWLQKTRLKRRHSWSASSNVVCIDMLSTDTISHQDFQLKFSQLDSDIKQIKESNDFLRIKNDELEKSITLINQEYLKIQAELKNVHSLLKAAQTENEKLNLIILQKDETISKLSSENEKLKKHILTMEKVNNNCSSRIKSNLGFFN